MKKHVLYQNRKERGSITFMDSLTLLFLYLKFTHHIDWNWFMVLLPVLGQMTLDSLSGACAGMYDAISSYVQERKRDKERKKSINGKTFHTFSSSEKTEIKEETKDPNLERAIQLGQKNPHKVRARLLKQLKEEREKQLIYSQTLGTQEKTYVKLRK